MLIIAQTLWMQNSALPCLTLTYHSIMPPCALPAVQTMFNLPPMRLPTDSRWIMLYLCPHPEFCNPGSIWEWVRYRDGAQCAAGTSMRVERNDVGTPA